MGSQLYKITYPIGLCLANYKYNCIHCVLQSADKSVSLILTPPNLQAHKTIDSRRSPLADKKIANILSQKLRQMYSIADS